MRLLFHFQLLLALSISSYAAESLPDSPELIVADRQSKLVKQLQQPWALRAHDCYPMRMLLKKWGQPDTGEHFVKGYLGLNSLPLVAMSNPVVAVTSLFAITPFAPRQSTWKTATHRIDVDHGRTLFCGYEDHIYRISISALVNDDGTDESSPHGQLELFFQYKEDRDTDDQYSYTRSGELLFEHQWGRWSGVHDALIDYERIEDITIDESYAVSSELNYEISRRHYWVAELEYEKHRLDDLRAAVTSTLSYRYTPKMTHDLTVFIEPGVAYQRSEFADKNIEFDTKLRYRTGLTWEVSKIAELEFFITRAKSVDSDLKNKSVTTTLSLPVSDAIEVEIEYKHSEVKSADNNVDDVKREFGVKLGYSFELF